MEHKKIVDSDGNIKRYVKIKLDCDVNPYEPVGMIDASINDLLDKNITQDEFLKKFKPIGFPTTYKRKIKKDKHCWIQVSGICTLKVASVNERKNDNSNNCNKTLQKILCKKEKSIKKKKQWNNF